MRVFGRTPVTSVYTRNVMRSSRWPICPGALQGDCHRPRGRQELTLVTLSFTIKKRSSATTLFSVVVLEGHRGDASSGRARRRLAAQGALVAVTTVNGDGTAKS
jgi:hypothetical protein